VHPRVTHVVEHLLARGVPGVAEVLLHLGLPVHPHTAPDEVVEVDVVPLPRPLQVDAPVLVALPQQPRGQPGGLQQRHRGVLEDAGPDAGLHVLPGAGLDHDRLDTTSREQVGEQQSGRTGTDDGDLGTHAAK
jgi:hypothetical protein